MHSQTYSGLSLIIVILRNNRVAGANGSIPLGKYSIFLSYR